MPHTQKLLKIFDRNIVLKNINSFRYQMVEATYRLIRPSVPDPIFLIGCSRSGTTVTFETLRKSSQLISFPYELPQLWHSLYGPWDNQWASECANERNADLAHREKVLAYFYARLGKGQVLDKSCINILRIPYLHALFPNARFVYIYRDGRDNVSSLMDGWRHNGHFNLKPLLGEIPGTIAINEGEFSDWSFFLPPNWRDYNDASLEEVCAHQWNTANTLALEAKPLIAENKWIELRYEDLVESPVELFENVFSRLNLDFDDTIKAHCAVLNKRPTSIVAGPPKREKWRIHNPDAITKILPKIEPLMTRLGYR